MFHSPKTGIDRERRIDLQQPRDVLYWTQTLHVSSDALRQAVECVGSLALDVGAYLARRR